MLSLKLFGPDYASKPATIAGTWTDSPESVHSFPCYHAVLVFMPPCCLTMSVRFNALKVESLSVDITLMGH